MLGLGRGCRWEWDRRVHPVGSVPGKIYVVMTKWGGFENHMG